MKNCKELKEQIYIGGWVGVEVGEEHMKKFKVKLCIIAQGKSCSGLCPV